MPGRSRKSTIVSTGKIGKQATAIRAAQERKLKIDGDSLGPPKWLGDFAKKEFLRVVEEAGKIDLLDNLDLAVLAIYSNAYSRYVDIVTYINVNGVIGTRESRQGAYEIVSPYVLAQEKYVKQIMTCSSKLGLATTDRLKLIVPVADNDQPENKYLRFIK